MGDVPNSNEWFLPAAPSTIDAIIRTIISPSVSTIICGWGPIAPVLVGGRIATVVAGRITATVGIAGRIAAVAVARRVIARTISVSA